MMIRRRVGLLAVVSTVAAMAGFTQAQEDEDPRQLLRRRFEASGLREGVAFPDVQIYDAEGKPFRTGELKGGYSVLVTGCLT